MSFDIHRSLQAVKLYGFLLVSLVAVAVLQIQRLVSGLFAGDGFGAAWEKWGAHIGLYLAENFVAVLLVTGIAAFFDIFDLRKIGGARR